jgi:hypothetical protein
MTSELMKAVEAIRTVDLSDRAKSSDPEPHVPARHTLEKRAEAAHALVGITARGKASK